MRRFGDGLVTVVGLFAILVLTLLVLRLPVGESLKLLYEGAFGNEVGVHRTLVRAIPLVICGLGVIVAWRAGMYNIGGEGQFVAGGIAAATVVKPFFAMSQPPSWWIVFLLAGTASVAGGAAWGALAGWLYVKRGVEVVISTILLNFIALQLLVFLASGPLQETKHQLPLSDRLTTGMMLPKFNPQTDLHIGIFLAVLTVVVVYVVLYRTKAGFCLRLVGENARVARANRINSGRVRLLSMALSGGLCGLAGGIEYAGVAGQLGGSFSQQWGFLAIPVALLAALNPIWLIPSAIYFAAILAGSKTMAGFVSDGTVLIYVIQAAAVLGLVAIRAFTARRTVRTEGT